MLDDLFFPRDVDLVKQIKPVTTLPDFWCWKHNKSGAYYVKSCYWLACQINMKELLIVARMQSYFNGLKYHIWKLLTTPKIKSFL